MLNVIKIKLDKIIKNSKYKDLSYRKLADEIGVSHVPLWKMIHNEPYNPSLEMIDKICEFFKCKPGDLLEYRKNH